MHAAAIRPFAAIVPAGWAPRHCYSTTRRSPPLSLLPPTRLALPAHITTLCTLVSTIALHDLPSGPLLNPSSSPAALACTFHTSSTCARCTLSPFLQEFKTQWPFNPDSYLGYRGPDELETVTGALLQWCSVGAVGSCLPSVQTADV